MSKKGEHQLSPGDMPKVSKAQLELYKTYAEFELKRETRATAHTAVKRLPLIVAFVCLGWAINSLAGEETRVQVAAQVVAWFSGLELNLRWSLTVNSAFSLLIAGREVVYRKQIRRLGKEKVELERIIDSRRTTSGIAEDGRTQPEDE